MSRRIASAGSDGVIPINPILSLKLPTAPSSVTRPSAHSYPPLQSLSCRIVPTNPIRQPPNFASAEIIAKCPWPARPARQSSSEDPSSEKSPPSPPFASTLWVPAQWSWPSDSWAGPYCPAACSIPSVLSATPPAPFPHPISPAELTDRKPRVNSAPSSTPSTKLSTASNPPSIARPSSPPTHRTNCEPRWPSSTPAASWHSNAKEPPKNTARQSNPISAPPGECNPSSNRSSSWLVPMPTHSN